MIFEFIYDCKGLRHRESGFGRSGQGVVRRKIKVEQRQTKTKLQAKEPRRRNYGYKY
jgi:hypothetical protein